MKCARIVFSSSWSRVEQIMNEDETWQIKADDRQIAAKRHR